jgi:hypothetical protein
MFTHLFLFYASQELYVTSSKHEKLKISKAIVAAVRQFGGRFIEMDETRGNAYFEIGDERSWKKTSQALREKQAEIRAQLDAEGGGSNQIEYQQVISEQRFYAYACKILESLYSGNSGISACGPDCPHAKRRQTLNQLGANPMQIYYAMQTLSPQSQFPPPQGMIPQQQLPQDNNMQYNPCYHGASYFTPTSSATTQGSVDLYEPLPYAPPATGSDSLDPLPYVPNHVNASMMMQGGYAAAEMPPPPPHFHQTVIQPVLERPRHIHEPETSMGSVYSLRKICSDDIEWSSEEGKVLIELLGQEVDDILRRKSYGLIEIDTTHAFEDLVFDDDIDDIPLGEFKEFAPVERIRKASSSTTTRSSSSRISGLSLKDDMSLMNMSVLSLDDHHPKDEHASLGGMPQKSSNLNSDTSAPVEFVKRQSRVSFLTNMSLMSMDNSSFSQLVSSLTDQDNQVNNESKERKMSGISFDSPAHLISRKVGFPLRNTFIKSLGMQGLANESGQTIGGQSNLTMSDTSINKSDLSITNSADQADRPMARGKGSRRLDIDGDN